MTSTGPWLTCVQQSLRGFTHDRTAATSACSSTRGGRTQQMRSSCLGNTRHLHNILTPDHVIFFRVFFFLSSFLFVAMSAADICTTSSVCSRRTLAAVLLQMFTSSGAATNVPPTKEGGEHQLKREAAACPWHRLVL